MTNVKVCGITNAEDAEEAVRLGAWAVGLVHHAESPRYCPPDLAAELAAPLKRRCEVVGVFVNATLDEVDEAAENADLSIIQLHGDEGPSFCDETARRTGCRVIKAFRVRSAADVRRALSYRTDYHLFDAHSERARGGTGESFDWELLAGRRSPVPALLSGGLRPDNVRDAISVVEPFAVDVSSGLESKPGVKDHDLMGEFFEAVAAATVQA